MPSTKEIRRRIKSVKSTRQITRAMELVAAAKMRKAQMQTLATRAYARLAWELIQNLINKADSRIHKLLRRPKSIKKTLVVLLTSNRGLIGGFNHRIIETAVAYAKRFEQTDFVSLGKKGRDALRKHDFSIIADFEKHDTADSVKEIKPLADLVIAEFLGNRYDRVSIVYMDFVSTLLQKPKILELLPLKKPEPAENVSAEVDYLFEPSADLLLEDILPRLTVMQIYQTVLETNAAEHSARMVAMKNASDSAGDLILELTLEFNQLRQAGITKEISEIVSGKLALSQN